MLLIAICILIAIYMVAVFRNATKPIKERWEMFGCMFVLLMFSFLVIYCFIGIAWRKNTEYHRRETYELVALKDNTTIQGSIFFFSGTMRYYFYYKESNGALKLQSIPVRNTEIYEEQRNDGTVTRYDVWGVTKSGFNWLSPIPYWDRKCSKYVVRIPEGTIKRDFVLDLE